MLKNSKKFNKIAFKRSAFSLATLLTSGHVYAQLLPEQTYDDQPNDMLVNANNSKLGLDVAPWAGLNSTDQGVVYQNGGNTVLSGANLIIDYSNASTPKFVIGGYGFNAVGSNVANNTVTIRNGAVDGNIYGGIAHTIKTSTDALTATQNSSSKNIAAAYVNNVADNNHVILKIMLAQ